MDSEASALGDDGGSLGIDEDTLLAVRQHGAPTIAIDELRRRAEAASLVAASKDEAASSSSSSSGGSVASAHAQLVVTFSEAAPRSVTRSTCSMPELLAMLHATIGAGAAPDGLRAPLPTLALRDLRLIEYVSELSVAPPGVLLRHGCAVVNLPPLRCVVLPSRVVFFPPPCPAGVDLPVLAVLQRLEAWCCSPGLAKDGSSLARGGGFVFVVLETVLQAVVQSLTTGVAAADAAAQRASDALRAPRRPPPETITQIRACKTVLTTLATRARALVGALDALLRDDADVAALVSLSLGEGDGGGGDYGDRSSDVGVTARRQVVALEAMVDSYGLLLGEQAAHCAATLAGIEADEVCGVWTKGRRQYERTSWLVGNVSFCRCLNPRRAHACNTRVASPPPPHASAGRPVYQAGRESQPAADA